MITTTTNENITTVNRTQEGLYCKYQKNLEIDMLVEDRTIDIEYF